ncbi:class I SAM-dependent methyltransferase [Patescibacteria group bacterium]|nr:class I SAM-dependent methyltransferase [Patescibacteria group bacterium]MBU4511765.1 class I SAM-dependent methyltransferase [Patescibacteria group bacterium]
MTHFIGRTDKKICDLCGAESIFFKLLYDLGDFKIVKCRKCGFVFRNVILDFKETERLYSENYFTEEQKDYFFQNRAVKIKDFTERISNIEKIHLTKGRILDVGCAIGTFLHICKQRGWEIYGQEISEYAANYAQRELNSQIFKGKLSELNLPANYFDVVTLWDVVDHSEESVRLLKDTYRILKNGGLIAVQTDMEDSLIYRLAHWCYVLSRGLIKSPVKMGHPIHHCVFYTPNTLRMALSSVGFKAVGIKRVPFPRQLVSVRQAGLLQRIMFDSLNSIGNLVRPLEAVAYGKK